jgi:hypothetical protein
MAEDLDKISIHQFCDLQGGISEMNRVALVHQHKNKLKSYGEWYDVIGKEVEISEKKDFNVAKQPNKKN